MHSLGFLLSPALQHSATLSLRGRTWRRLKELYRCSNSTCKICFTFTARQQERKSVISEQKSSTWGGIPGARGSAKVQIRSYTLCSIVLQASVSQIFNSINESAAAPCAPHAAHTTRRESLAILSRRCDVFPTLRIRSLRSWQCLVAPGLPFPRLRGWRWLAFSAGGDVH